VSDTELLHKSKPEPVRRLEVLTRAGRRRTWTAEQKAQILAESYESGEKVSAVARRHGLTPQQLFGWRRDARRAMTRRRLGDRTGGQLGTCASDCGGSTAAHAGAHCAGPAQRVAND
jgi:transposase